jgi:hypothetical protein
MADAYTEIANQLETIINVEFAPEGYVAVHDTVHPAAAVERTMIGIAPQREAPGPDMLTLEHRVQVQFYGRYDPEPDPRVRVDPRRITGFADRFKRAVKDHNQVSTPNMWYFDVVSIEYPNDGGGNKTRFEASIRAYGNNQALIETVA